MKPDPRDWRPTATRARLEQRAAALRETRAFFAERRLLEVDTPQLVRHAVTDVNLHSFEVRLDGAEHAPRFLHTSPEYAMKRLLAAGSGDIWQLCHVFRGEEQGPLHNGEFALIEWYRVGWTMTQLMAEVAALVQRLAPALAARPVSYLSYAEAIRQALGVDPLSGSDAALRQAAQEQGFDAGLVRGCTRDELLDLLMGARVGPTLGRLGLCFVHRYPASQAALAQLDPDDPRVALRFELYCEGVELANGFQELASATEQRARFEADNRERERRGLPRREADVLLLAALEAGLPACAGVAVGFDRVLLLATGAQQLSDVMAFPVDRA
ncbi:MAG TPA: EF-P lysine aminoacylase EpmA [Steroidobacteraceae bacterium]|nr:EF-P lysine aminoacylase EpmA [Steroidobacteraceae bacterium]